MMSTNNILSPANGKPIIVPTQDIVLGLYYLSLMLEGEPGEGMVFANLDEVQQALERGRRVAAQQDLVPPAGAASATARPRTARPTARPTGSRPRPGACCCTRSCPRNPAISFDRLLNQLLTKREITQVVDEVYRHCGQKETVVFADRLMTLGFSYAARAGISFGKDDMVVPATKAKFVGETRELVKQYEQQYADGLITKGEKYNKVVDAWAQCTDRVADEMMSEIRATARVKDPATGRFNQPNSIFMMADSGARGSAAQIKQLAGMRGLMAKPSGEIIETPIISNFKEGLSVLEYFNSTHGARKGLADTALKTANSGYLTRRLVDVAQDCIIVEDDCGTERSITLAPVIQGGEVIEELAERILGRTVAEDIKHPVTGEVLAERGELLDEEKVRHPRRGGGRERAGALGPDLRQPGRRVQPLLWPRSRPRHAGQQRRGGRRDRRAEHRRARHPAHHAHLPHRRRGPVAGRALERRGHGERRSAADQPQPGGRQQAAPRGARAHHRARAARRHRP